MRDRLWFLAVLLAAVAVLSATACSDSSAPRSVLRVETINGNEPLRSDVLRGDGEDASVLEDEVVIEIRNLPHDEVLALATSPYNSVLLKRYEVRFESDEAIPPVTGALGWQVGVGRQVSGAIVVVPAGLKVVAPLVSLQQGGEIQAVAHLTFFGEESGSNEEVRFGTVLQVNFANWTDE